MIPWQISFAILKQIIEALGIQTESENLAFGMNQIKHRLGIPAESEILAVGITFSFQFHPSVYY